MTKATDQSIKAEEFAAMIKNKMAQLPAGAGYTTDDIIKAIKSNQSSSIIEQAVDDFLKTIKSKDRGIINRITIRDDEQLIDNYDFKTLDVCFYQYFCSVIEDKYIYSDIHDFINESYMSLNGRTLAVFENIAAGRTAADAGMLRTLLNSASKKIFDTEKRNI